MTEHIYLPTTFILDKCTAFMSHVIKKWPASLASPKGTPLQSMVKQLGCFNDLTRQLNRHWKLRPASGDHCGISTSTLRTLVKHIYHASSCCEPSRVFHGRILFNVLDSKMGIRLQKNLPPDSQIAQDVLEQREMISPDARKNAMQSYIKHKA